MNSRNLLKTYIITVTFASVITTASIAGSTIPTAWADHEKINGKYSTIQELADAIEDKEYDDDDVKHFTQTTFYQTIDADTKECIEDAEELGNNLNDYEIEECVEEEQ